MIEVVVFDLDDTLYDEKTFVFQGFTHVAEFLIPKLPKKACFEELCALFYESRPLVFDRLLKKHGIYSKPLVKGCVRVYRTAPRKLSLYPEAKKCLERLKKTPLYLVTDGNYLVQERKVRALHIDHYFKKIFYTSRYGLKHAKPSAYCFTKIAALEDCEPKCISYVGDNPAKDFVGIKPLGFKTVRVHTGQYGKVTVSPEFDAEIQIKNLEDLTWLQKP